MNIKIHHGYPENLDEIEALYRSFGDFKAVVVEHILANRKNLLCAFAYSDEGQLIGCKMGFSPRPMYFESAMGGVHQDFQNQGIAKALALELQAEIKAQGFKFMETITANDNLAMQLVNLKTGMKIVGAFQDRGNELKLKFQKEL